MYFNFDNTKYMCHATCITIKSFGLVFIKTPHIKIRQYGKHIHLQCGYFPS